MPGARYKTFRSTYAREETNGDRHGDCDAIPQGYGYHLCLRERKLLRSRSRRKLIGKLDKETGEVIPTGKRGPKKKERAASGTPAAGGNPEEAPALRERILELEKEVQILRSRVKVLTDENRAIGEAKAESERLKLENRRMEGLISSIRELVT